jgi:hypothetical protein
LNPGDEDFCRRPWFAPKRGYGDQTAGPTGLFSGLFHLDDRAASFFSGELFLKVMRYSIGGGDSANNGVIRNVTGGANVMRLPASILPVAVDAENMFAIYFRTKARLTV